MSSEKVVDLQDRLNIRREKKEYEYLEDFQGLKWEEVFGRISSNSPEIKEADIHYNEEGDNLDQVTRPEMNSFKEQTSAELRHQKELDEHRYNSLSDRLSNDIKSSFRELDFKQQDALKDIKHENDTYIKSIETQNKELISDLKEELRQERKSDRNTIIGWVLGASAVVVPIATFLIPYILKLFTN